MGSACWDNAEGRSPFGVRDVDLIEALHTCYTQMGYTPEEVVALTRQALWRIDHAYCWPDGHAEFWAFVEGAVEARETYGG